MRNRFPVNTAFTALAVRLVALPGVAMAGVVLKLWGSPEPLQRVLTAAGLFLRCFFPAGFSCLVLAGIWRWRCPREVRR